jgi:hypothetical protein
LGWELVNTLDYPCWAAKKAGLAYRHPLNYVQMFALSLDWSTDQIQGKLHLHEASLPKRQMSEYDQDISVLDFSKDLTSNYWERSPKPLDGGFVNLVDYFQLQYFLVMWTVYGY